MMFGMTKHIPTILIADDETEIVALYKRKFEQSGFRVLTVSDGAQAIKIATSEKPDIVLMDVKMPNIDGITAQKKLHEDPETKDIKVIFLTAFSEPAAQEMYENLEKTDGVPGIIRKGDDLNELVSQVRKYLELKR